ncbi:MAG: HNH endonuclease [Paludibacteraceae bacterium]|nr:HNH endonuclease [Paludibacteraceae bacterium]
MTIKQMEVTVREITDGYVNNEEQGVRGYKGQLDIRPPYQREFIYNEKEQQAVIKTVLNGYPLNVMYWVKRSDDAECPYEVMDGQQRTLSLCEYVAGKYSYEFKNFFNQPQDIQEKILDYKLTIYVCEGEASDKLEWFRTINIAGKPLNEQEINNAVYAGPFVTDAKRHFSKSNCAAYRLGKDLVNGTPIRQEFLKKALEWMAEHETRNGHPQSAVGYMSVHQHDPNANNLWTYFQNVLNWATTNFDPRRFRRIMKGLDWAWLYDKYGSETLDTEALGKRISILMRDSEIQRQTGIIPFVLTGDEHYLDLRTFPDDIKLAKWEEQEHKCSLCGKEFDIEFMEGDHITPWKDGGRTVAENCQMLCRECNRRKSSK